MKISTYQIENYIKNIASQKIAGCLIFGQDQSLIDHYWQKISRKIVDDINDPFLVVNINKDKIKDNPSIIVDEYYSIAMMGGRKLIIIDASISEVAQSLKIIFDDNDCVEKTNNFLLIIASDLEKFNKLRKISEASKSFAAIACYQESQQNVAKYTAEKLNNISLPFNPEIVELIYNKANGNRNLIDLEVKKLDLYFHNNDSKEDVSRELISNIITDQSSASIDEFVQKFCQKDYITHIKTFKELIANHHNNIMIIRFLINYLTKLYNAKIAIKIKKEKIDQVIKEQKIFFKQEPLFKKSLFELRFNDITKRIYLLQDCEVKSKQGNIYQDLVFYNFLLNFS
jgi:DNA polymerase-3 subunit delta